MTYGPGYAAPPDDQGVAIIGMSGRFPGARDVDEFWRNLTAGHDARTAYTDEQLRSAGVPQELLDDPAYVKSGYPLDEFAHFDAEFFGVSRTEAELMDPQHRQFLEVSWHALERAGYAVRPDQLRTGVFASTSAGTYLRERVGRDLASEEVSDELQTAVGNDPSTVSLRVSYKLDLRGPSFTVQCACSSSLVAVHLAVQSLLSRECDLALAGGVAVRMLEPRGYRYEQGAILSTDGHCRPLDADATGTVSGDGAGAVVLKRLTDALADGDHIHAVIRGSAINNDGSEKVGFTAPSPEGQAAAIAEALAVAEVDPASIGYVETHGTGTPLGDPIEVSALTETLAGGDRTGPCYLGAVKSNIGHLDAAAGVAGLIKAALVLEHRLIPPTAHFRRPNPALGIADGDTFVVNADGTAWPESGQPPRAGVSAFGVGGTNAHVVLEAAPVPVPPQPPQRPWQVLPVSARTEAAADEAAARLAAHLESTELVSLADVAHTLQVGRPAMAYRRAVVADSAVDAAAALRRPAGGDRGPAVDTPALVYLLPGQGSQYAGMGARLHAAEPVFRAAMDDCAELLVPHLGWDVREVAFAGGEQARQRLRQTLYTQPTVFCLDYALAKLLESWGVRPDAMTGHSLGELVAATLAGVFTLPDALRVVATRARLMRDLAPGRMLSALADEETVIAAVGGNGTVAAVNAPGSCVVAGTADEVDRARDLLVAQGITVRELETSHAFHTALVEPALPGLERVLGEVTLHRPRSPFLSNVTGTWVSDEQATDPAYWVRHTRAPVRFADTVMTAAQRGNVVFVEVGPGSALSGLVRSRPEPSAVVTLLPRARDSDVHGVHDEQRSVLAGVAQLWAHGVDVAWKALHGKENRRRVPLPGYPFQRVEYLRPKPEQNGAVSARRERERWTYAPVWHRAPLPGRAAVDGEPARWLVLEDEHGLAARITEALRKRGEQVVSVRTGSGFVRRGDDAFDADPASATDLAAIVDALRLEDRLPRRVLHAWSVIGDGPDPDDVTDRYRSAQQTGLYALVELAQALGGAAEPVRIDVLTNDLTDAGDGVPRRPERATVHGAVTVLPQEYPALSCAAVDVTLPADEPGLQRMTGQLLAELSLTPQGNLVAYRGGRRLLQAFAPVPLAPAEVGQPWHGGGYLVTGVTQELGLVHVEHLAAAGARLVLVGDPDFPAQRDWPELLAAGDVDHPRLARLAALVDGGAGYVVADLADPVQARQVVDTARLRLDGIRGVLHLADVRGTGMVALKTRADFTAVLDARVRSTLLLADLCADDDLDHFVLGSSTTGVVGGFGQLDNCAAAAFLDAFAAAGSGAGRPVVAIDWAQWEFDDWFEQQMAGLPEVRARYERLRKAQGIGVADGLAVGDAVLASGLPRVVVSTVDFADVLADQRMVTATSFAESLGAAREPEADDGWDPATVWPDDEVAQSVARIWRDLLGASSITDEDDFYDLGGNSLFAIQIVSRLRQVHGDFPMSAIFEASTVPGLAAAIRQHQAENIGLDEFEALLAEVEGLSAADAEASLKGNNG